MQRYGLDYGTLRKENPGLVYCAISACAGEPATSRPGYDIVMQTVSGLMSITGPRGGGPVKVGVAVLDGVAGLYAAVGILAALEARQRTGRGDRLEISLFEASVAALVNQAANHLIGGVVPGPMGTEHPNIVP